ncbi:MAG: hypothetical protein AB7E81_03365 [Hyphomicrobiaceae bacterium]
MKPASIATRSEIPVCVHQVRLARITESETIRIDDLVLVHDGDSQAKHPGIVDYFLRQYFKLGQCGDHAFSATGLATPLLRT